MNTSEKMKKMVLSMAGILAALLIVCVIIIPRGYQTPMMLAVTVLWVVTLYLRIDKMREEQPKKRAMQVIDLEPDYKTLFTQQLQCRVQEKLRSKFPGAIIELCENEIERIAKSGNAVYVPIKKADDYCHMSISMRGNGDIQLNLFSLVNLEQVHQEALKALEKADNHKEIDQWYSQKGQQLLTELITSMNSRGHTKLSINEKGDVMVQENGRNVMKDCFKDIPSREHWNRLKELMEEDEVKVQVSGKRLTIAW